MKFPAPLLSLALTALSLSAAAQTAFTPSHRLILSTELSQLDRGFADWREHSLRYVRLSAPRTSTEVGLTGTRRFGLDDTQIDLAHTRPLGERLVGTVQASASPTERVLPSRSVGANLQYEFAPAWLLHGGLRHTRYPSTEVNRLNLMLERYVGNFSASLAWAPSRALGESTSVVEARGTWFWSERASLGLIASRGDEATELGPGRVVLADVRSVALVGRQPLGAHYAITYSISHTRQGEFYTRKGVGIGVQRDF